MKKSSVIFTLILLNVICFYELSWAKNSATVAVLDFESIGTEEHLGKAVAEIIRTELVGMKEYRVVERAQINRAISEQALQKSGLMDDKSAMQIGMMIGADLIIIGSVVKIGMAYTINSRMIDVKTGEVELGRNVTGNDLNLLTKLSQDLIMNLFGDKASPAVPGAATGGYRDKSAQAASRWHYDENFWLLEGNRLRNVGHPKDAVAWFEQAMPEETDLTLTYTAKTRDGSDYYEMIFILYGNHSLGSDFWDDGIIVNYAVGNSNDQADGHQSWVRFGNIYRSPTWVLRQTHLPLFKPNTPHTVRFIYKNNRLSFFIDDIPIFRNVLIPVRKAQGYLGVANFWNNRHESTVSDVSIRKFN